MSAFSFLWPDTSADADVSSTWDQIAQLAEGFTNHTQETVSGIASVRG